MTELQFDDSRLLFSYETPVAVELPNGDLYKTDKKWSATTSRHVNEWLNGNKGIFYIGTKPQEFFDDLCRLPSLVK